MRKMNGVDFSRKTLNKQPTIHLRIGYLRGAASFIDMTKIKVYWLIYSIQRIYFETEDNVISLEQLEIKTPFG